MKNNKIKWTAAGALASVALVTSALAQSSDALLDKLVEKGILTTKEANELREETDKGFNTAYAVKSGMPDWVTSLKFGGDFRGRIEGFYGDNPDFVDRHRFRYRLRFGAVATIVDDFEVGLRLTSSDAAGGFTEGDPISGNTTLQNNGSKKFVFIDQAYAKWSPLKGPEWTGGFTIGKMENPFVFSDMVFDGDYTPEGAAAQLGYALNDRHALKFNGAGFVLDEIGNSAHDPYMLGAQIRWDAVWNKKIATTAGVAGLDIVSSQNLTNGAVPNVNRGNSRAGGTGPPQYHFNPIVADASLIYTLESFPKYPGAFPIKIGGDYMYNPAAPSSVDNYAYSAGVLFGKSGKRGTWDLSYTWKWLGGDSWWEEFTDSDFGAFYDAGNSPPNSGAGIGYGAGTNVKGHIIKASYSPNDSLTLSVKWFLTELINPFPPTSDSQISRLQVDAVWKF
jgi:hypothetical protein